MIKEMKLNDYFGETINIEEATMVSIVHTKANTTNDDYQAGEHDHVQIEIQCDDAPSRAGGIYKKSILINLKGVKNKLLYVDGIQFDDVNITTEER